MKGLGIGILVGVVLACAAAGQSTFDAEGIAEGKTILWFAGTRITARIESDLAVGGTLVIDGREVPFRAAGSATGEAAGDSSAMTLDVWILFQASGTTECDEPFSMHGGMAGSSDNADLTANPLGSAAGPFFLIVTLGSDTYRVTGTGEGSAAGTFVVPDDPLTMQIEGTGTYALRGDLVADAVVQDEGTAPSRYLEYLPWDPSAWPDELLAYLLDLLEGGAREPAADVEADPARS